MRHRILTVGLLGCLATVAQAQGTRWEGTPNIGSFFASEATPSGSEQAVLRRLSAYNRRERALARKGTVRAGLYVAQGQKLRRLRKELEALERAGALAALSPTLTSAYRAELADLFDGAKQKVAVLGASSDASLRTSELERTEDLLRTALIANLRFGFTIREVNGFLVDPEDG